MQIFILGQSSDLAKQELITIIQGQGGKISHIGSNFIIGQSPRHAEELQAMLGGTIKIGNYLGDLRQLEDLTAQTWTEYLRPFLHENKKNNFGFSLYNAPRSAYQTAQRLALATKKILIAEKYKARLVSSRAPELSSVIVSKNDLLQKELLIIKQDQRWLLGLTQTVQDFGKYGERDMGRPARDDRSGMLPPKVAQMMINLAGPNREKNILDPFCGSGTILQEAMLLGYAQIRGTDLSQRAVSDCRQNLEWLQQQFRLETDYSVEPVDARDLNQKIAAASLDLIVSEPFMGDARQLHRQDNIHQLMTVKKELENLYYKTFVQFHTILKNDGRIIFVFPIFNVGGQKISTLAKENLEKIGFKMILPNIKSAGLSAAGNIIYSREHQLVQREITLWQKK